MDTPGTGRMARIALAAALGSTVVAAAAHSAPARSPRWVLHAGRFPAGLSQGVRAYALQAVQAGNGLAAPAGPSQAPLSNVKMNADNHPPLPQNETSVALDLTDPTKAVAASNDYAEGGLWIGHTADGGRTWSSFFQSPQVSTTHDKCTGSDPSVVYSRRDKAFYVSTLCFFLDHAESEIDVWKSVDGGAHWTPSRLGAIAASNVRNDGSVNKSLFNDKPLLAVDNNPGSPFYGRLYITYARFHMRPDGFSDYCPLHLAFTDSVPTSNPRTTRWRHVAMFPDAPGAGGKGASADQWATPVVDDRGGVDVAYVAENCNSGADSGLFFKRSMDGGRTFRKRVKINKPGEFADNPNRDDVLPDKRAPLAISPSLAFNPGTGSLVYVFQNGVHRRTSGADISFVRSTDLGAHWSHARTISVTGAGDPAPHDQFFPWITATESGTLYAIWFDNRNDPNNRLIETYRAVSTDDGATWTSGPISDRRWNPNRSFFDCGCFIGDYTGIAASDTVVYPVWTDGRDTPGPPLGQTDIYTDVEILTP